MVKLDYFVVEEAVMLWSDFDVSIIKQIDRPSIVVYTQKFI